jgi:hypothetical protein
MDGGQLAIDLGEGSYCGGCPAAGACGEIGTARACQPMYGDPRYGGTNVLHPARHDFGAYFAEVRGPAFDDVRALATPVLDLPLSTPRLRAKRDLRGLLYRPFYAVGPDQVIAGRRAVLSADDLRDLVDLWSNQGLALTLFGSDPEMEELWSRRREIVSQIAEAGYDFVAPPSFSARPNHPPAEFLYNAKRSLIFFEMLQAEGVASAPRLAWLSDHDVTRAAKWCNGQEAVELVTMDLAVKQPGEWANQLRLLRRFDDLTGRRLAFFIHGPAAESRLIELFSILGPRLRLTGSRAISRPRRSAADFVSFAEEEEAVAFRSLMAAGAGPAQGPERRNNLWRVPTVAAGSSQNALAA